MFKIALITYFFFNFIIKTLKNAYTTFKNAFNDKLFKNGI